MFVVERKTMKKLDMVALKLFGVSFLIEMMFPALLKQDVLFHQVETNRKFQV